MPVKHGEHGKIKLDDDAIVAAYERGESAASIARRMYVSLPTILRRLTARNVHIRSCGEQTTMQRYRGVGVSTVDSGR